MRAEPNEGAVGASDSQLVFELSWYFYFPDSAVPNMLK